MKILKEILKELKEIKKLLRTIVSNTEQDKDYSVVADKIYSALKRSTRIE